VRIRAYIVAFVVALSGVALAQHGAPQPSKEEYKVYAAAIDAFQKAGLASHPVIADRTSTFECDSGCNGLTIDGCNGLRNKNETAAARLEIVQRDLRELEGRTISDFESKNQRCSQIENKIPAESQYLLLGQSSGKQLPAGWEHPDLFYFSRVAVHGDQALVHISFMSGTNPSDSGGKYFLFSKETGKWMPNGSSHVWKLVQHLE